MGVSTSAKLIYGYRLKTEDDWLVKEIHGPDSDEWGLNLPWLVESDDFQDKAEERLREAVGYVEGDFNADPDGWRQRLREADAKVGVKFEAGGYEYGDLFLATKTYRADLGEVEAVTPGGLLVMSGPTANDRLRRALEVLGVTPLQESPAWLLTACRG